MDTDSAIEEGGSEEIGVAWTPFDLEGPVVGRREFANDF